MTNHQNNGVAHPAFFTPSKELTLFNTTNEAIEAARKTSGMMSSKLRKVPEIIDMVGICMIDDYHAAYAIYSFIKQEKTFYYFIDMT